MATQTDGGAASPWICYASVFIFCTYFAEVRGSDRKALGAPPVSCCAHRVPRAACQRVPCAARVVVGCHARSSSHGKCSGTPHANATAHTCVRGVVSPQHMLPARPCTVTMYTPHAVTVHAHAVTHAVTHALMHAMQTWFPCETRQVILSSAPGALLPEIADELNFDSATSARVSPPSPHVARGGLRDSLARLQSAAMGGGGGGSVWVGGRAGALPTHTDGAGCHERPHARAATPCDGSGLVGRGGRQAAATQPPLPPPPPPPHPHPPHVLMCIVCALACHRFATGDSGGDDCAVHFQAHHGPGGAYTATPLDTSPATGGQSVPFPMGK